MSKDPSRTANLEGIKPRSDDTQVGRSADVPVGRRADVPVGRSADVLVGPGRGDVPVTQADGKAADALPLASPSQTDEDVGGPRADEDVGAPADEDVGAPADEDVGAPASAREWHHRGYLPHRDRLHLLQSLTFRLADSLPQDVLDDLEQQLLLVPEVHRDTTKRKRIEAALDAGIGCCALANPEAAACVRDTLFHFDHQRYRIIAWVIMPNHVHVLVDPAWPIHKIIQGWKSFTARWLLANNERLGLRIPDSHHVWMRDYWDRFIRDDNHLQAVIDYIHENPVKAGLSRTAEAWPWSSAGRSLGRVGRSADDRVGRSADDRVGRSADVRVGPGRGDVPVTQADGKAADAMPLASPSQTDEDVGGPRADEAVGAPADAAVSAPATLDRIRALIAGETDEIAIMATIACELHHADPRFDWTGFYRVTEPGILKVGPYQGGHGCLTIPFSRGVCGRCAREGKTQLVDDVHAVPDHIACSSTTRSEIVVPVFDANGEVRAVLDIDSDRPAAFTGADAAFLESVCGLLREVFP